MLQKLRDRISGWFAAVFLGAIAVVFVFWGINFQSATTTAAARVNGEKVPLEEVRRAWQDRQAELQREMRDELPAELVRSEQHALLDDFIRRELLRQKTGELGYRIGDQKLVDTLKSIPALQVDGSFSRDRYAALLRQQGRARPDSRRTCVMTCRSESCSAASPSLRSPHPPSSSGVSSSRASSATSISPCSRRPGSNRRPARRRTRSRAGTRRTRHAT